MNGTKGARLLGALIIAAAVFSLAACTGAGLNLPAGEAYLNIYNPNDPSTGTFDYTLLYLDSTAQTIDKISAGQSYQLPKPVTVGTHTLDFDFVQNPNPGTSATTIQERGIVITIPSTSRSYTYTGPVYSGP